MNPQRDISGKRPAYWIKVGLLIGFGFLLIQILAPIAIVLLPFAAIGILIILLFGTAGRYLNSLLCYFKLKQGWAERSNRAARH